MVAVQASTGKGVRRVRPMSALGQKRTCAVHQAMAACTNSGHLQHNKEERRPPIIRAVQLSAGHLQTLTDRQPDEAGSNL
jgi:hypothetical protein